MAVLAHRADGGVVEPLVADHQVLARQARLSTAVRLDLHEAGDRVDVVGAERMTLVVDLVRALLGVVPDLVPVVRPTAGHLRAFGVEAQPRGPPDLDVLVQLRIHAINRIAGEAG